MKTKGMRFFVGTLTLLASLAMAPAHAIFGSGIVFDPTNLVQNTSSAMAAVRNEVNTARSYITMLQQLEQTARSVKSINGLASLAGVQRELALYNQLANVGSQMSGTLDRSLQLSQRLQAQYGASNMDWKTFITTKDQLSKDRAKAMASQFTSVDQSMKDIAQRRQAIVTELQAATGETAAMQSVGASIDVLIGQNQQLLGLLKAQGQDTLVKESVKDSDANRSMEELLNFQKERAEAANKFK